LGLFDEIRCKAPLPDGREGGDIWFQTSFRWFDARSSMFDEPDDDK
jgi:hypothetical protein